MAETVTIEFDVEDNGASAKIGKINQELGDTKQAGENAAEGTDSASLSLTDLNSAISIAEKGLQLLQSAYQNTAGVALEYADQVRQLSAISGESTENTSRFIQVLDDYKLSADDALTATRTLTKNGYAPNIDTLAKLSDQYLALNTAQERNDFILKNLGRSGLGWVEVLGKGSEAIKEQSAAINENLILTQESILRAREYELALDEWNDSVYALKVSIGNDLIPNLTAAIKTQDDAHRAAEIAKEDGIDLVTATRQVRDEYMNRARAEREAQFALENDSSTMDDAAISAEEYATQLKAVSDANKEFLSVLGSVQSSEEKYQDTAAKLTQDRIKLEEEKNKLLAQGYLEQSEKIQEVNEKLDENSQKAQQNADEHELANRRIILGLLERKLTQDGVLDDKELQWLLEKGVAWGVYSQQVVDETQKAIEEVNALTETINGIPISKSFTMSISAIYAQADSKGTEARPIGPNSRRAGGGSVSAGMPYLVGEHGPEPFIPSTNGTVISNNMFKNINADVVAAIYATRINEDKLASSITQEVLKAIR